MDPRYRRRVAGRGGERRAVYRALAIPALARGARPARWTTMPIASPPLARRGPRSRRASTRPDAFAAEASWPTSAGVSSSRAPWPGPSTRTRGMATARLIPSRAVPFIAVGARRWPRAGERLADTPLPPVVGRPRPGSRRRSRGVRRRVPVPEVARVHVPVPPVHLDAGARPTAAERPPTNGERRAGESALGERTPAPRPPRRSRRTVVASARRRRGRSVLGNADGERAQLRLPPISCSPDVGAGAAAHAGSSPRRASLGMSRSCGTGGRERQGLERGSSRHRGGSRWPRRSPTTVGPCGLAPRRAAAVAVSVWPPRTRRYPGVRAAVRREGVDPVATSYADRPGRSASAHRRRGRGSRRLEAYREAGADLPAPRSTSVVPSPSGGNEARVHPRAIRVPTTVAPAGW